MHRKERSKGVLHLGPVAAFVLSAGASAQISLSTAVNMAVSNDNRVKIAQADLAKAQAFLSESKDAFVPAVAATGGVGKSTGAPLGPPVVFSIAGQSLVYSASQADYIRAARAGIEAAHLAVDAARSDAAEDAASTYLTLDNALDRRRVGGEALGFAGRLVQVTDARFQAGVDAHMELTKARRTEAQLHLQQLLVEDEIATQTEHLAQLTGLPAHGLITMHETIPALREPAPPVLTDISASERQTGVSAAFSAARAKQLTAHGDQRYLLWPQVAFTANYARISTAFTNYTQYYPRFGADNNSFNSLSVGVQITLPLLDMVHRAKAREAAADAAHSLGEARLQQMQFLESRSKLRHTAAELVARRELASIDHDLAQDQLQVVTARLRADAAAAGGEQASPRDEANARLGERQRALDVLTAALQLEQTEVMLMRQEGSLTDWLAATLSTGGTPTTAVPSGPAVPARTSSPGSPAAPATSPLLPATIGVEPTSAAPGVPASVPTSGTAPSSLPSSPVTTPTPAGTPPATPPPQA